MSTNDWNVLVGNVVTRFFSNESLSSDDVQSGDSEDFVWVVGAQLFVDLSGDWDGGVDWVRNDANPSFWAMFSASLGQVGDNGGVGVEEIVSGHAWLSWDTSGDEDNIGTSNGFLHSGRVRTNESGDPGLIKAVRNTFETISYFGIDVGKISGNTRGDWVDIEARDVGDGVVALEEEGKGLSDSSGGAENSNVLVDLGGGREGSGGGSGEHSERSKVVTP